MTRGSIRRSRRGSQPVSVSTGGSARNRRAIQAVNQTLLDQPVATDVDRRRRLMRTGGEASGAAEISLGAGLIRRGDQVFLRQGKRIMNISDPTVETTTSTAAIVKRLIEILVEAQHLEA